MNLLKKDKPMRTDELRVVECLNLRAAQLSGGDVLTPVGEPQVFAGDNWCPLVMAGDALLVYDGCTIGCVSADGVHEIAKLPGVPRCAHVSQKYVNVMTDAGLYLLLREADGSFTDVGVKPDFGAIAVTAESVGAMQSVVPECAVSAITTAITSAYRDVVESARVAGAFVQPVVARCRLLDADGEVLHVTAPVVVMLPSGAQLADAWTFGSADGGTTIKSKTVTAQAYRLQVTVGDAIPAAWSKIVQTLELQVTPQFHPVDFAGTAEVSFGRDASSDSYVRVTIPGVERGLSATRYIASAINVKRAIERFDKIATTVAYISNPYASATNTVVQYANPIDVADEADNMATALAAAAPAHVTNALARVLTPHSFVADAVAGSADAVVWANITPQRFGGYAPGVYASTFASKQCTGYVAITFASGERVVTEFTGALTPLTLSPLIVYPSAEAVELTLQITVDGTTSMLSVKLTADATGRYAYYVSPTLLPITLTTAAKSQTPSPIKSDLSMPGYAAVANVSAVPQITAVCNVATNIIAITAARSGSSAWEYRRARFYAFAGDGIKLVTTNADRSECAVNLLDCRSVTNRFCVADGGNVVYALCADQLLQIAANSVKCVARDCVGDRLAWIAADNELLVANTDDSEAVHYCLDYDMSTFTSTLVPRGPWLAFAGKAYALTETGLVDLANRFVAEQTDVRWRAQYVVNRGRRLLPTAVRWMLKASNFCGNLTVERLWLTQLTPMPQTITKLKVNGAIKSPIATRLHGHRTIDLQLSVEASVSRDFSLTFPMIVCNK
jgi:hypothetical protein